MSPRCRAAIAVLAVLSAAPSATGESDAVRFTLGEGGAVIVPVFLEGQGPHPFLLDTGATRSSVSADLAARAGLTPVARTVMVTPAGDDTRAVVRLPGLSVGGALAEGLLATILPAVRPIEGVAGILGQDFLARFDYTIDYRRRRVTFGSSAAAEGIRLQLHRSEGRFLVDLEQPGTTARFVPDSGAAGFVVFDRADGNPLRSDPTPMRARVESASGARRVVHMRRLRDLRIGGIKLRDQVAAVVPRREADAPAGHGLLPLHQFASVTFAGRDGYMVIRVE